MKVVKTAESHAILTDDNEVVLPRDSVAMMEVVRSSPTVVTELVAALSEDVAAMLPVAKNFLKEASIGSMNRGVQAAMDLHEVSVAVATVQHEDGDHERE